MYSDYERADGGGSGTASGSSLKVQTDLLSTTGENIKKLGEDLKVQTAKFMTEAKNLGNHMKGQMYNAAYTKISSFETPLTDLAEGCVQTGNNIVTKANDYETAIKTVTDSFNS